MTDTAKSAQASPAAGQAQAIEPAPKIPGPAIKEPTVAVPAGLLHKIYLHLKGSEDIPHELVQGILKCVHVEPAGKAEKTADPNEMTGL
jgi:hypothetical protein